MDSKKIEQGLQFLVKGGKLKHGRQAGSEVIGMLQGLLIKLGRTFRLAVAKVVMGKDMFNIQVQRRSQFAITAGPLAVLDVKHILRQEFIPVFNYEFNSSNQIFHLVLIQSVMQIETHPAGFDAGVACVGDGA